MTEITRIDGLERQEIINEYFNAGKTFMVSEVENYEVALKVKGKLRITDAFENFGYSSKVWIGNEEDIEWFKKQFEAQVYEVDGTVATAYLMNQAYIHEVLSDADETGEVALSNDYEALVSENSEDLLKLIKESL